MSYFTSTYILFPQYDIIRVLNSCLLKERGNKRKKVLMFPMYSPFLLLGASAQAPVSVWRLLRLALPPAHLSVHLRLEMLPAFTRLSVFILSSLRTDTFSVFRCLGGKSVFLIQHFGEFMSLLSALSCFWEKPVTFIAAPLCDVFVFSRDCFEVSPWSLYFQQVDLLRAFLCVFPAWGSLS